MSLFLIASVTVLLGLLVMHLGAGLFRRIGFVDSPQRYGFDRKPVAYSMGIFSVLIFIVLSLFFLDFSIKLAAILGAVFCLGLVCFADDHMKLSSWFRLGIQFFVAAVVVVAGTEIFSVANPFGDPIELGMYGKLFSVFWIVAITNLINFLDGVSGLSSGVSSIGFFILFCLSIFPGLHQTDQTMVQVMALILFVLAFLNFVFEFPAPSPKFLMGDSGTMFFGFMLAVLSMVSGGKLATAALVLLIPLFDGVWVVSRRLFLKQSPFKGDYNHLHHRLERIGFSKQSILFMYIGISFAFGLIAIFVWNTIFKLISLVVLITALTITGYLVWIKETK